MGTKMNKFNEITVPRFLRILPVIFCILISCVFIAQSIMDKQAFSNTPPRPYNLVQDEEGYYGIVVSENEVFMGNGLTVVLKPDEMKTLKVCSISKTSGSIPADFSELITHPRLTKLP